ncbi:MAG: hypothetical protein IT239_00375 [Bacteroidia bacterium]|nr:hypothetical protein [Bacteroidia bacterium]
MKNNYSKHLGIALAATAVALSGCNSLNKMSKKYGTVQYTATPNPLELHGDSVKVAVSGKFAPKYYWKKATVKVTPVIKTPEGNVELKSKTFVGPKVKNAPKDAQVISKDGGSFSYNDVVAYKPSMANSTLEVKANGSYKTKSKDFPQNKIADATITTPLLASADVKTIMGKDAMPKTQSFNYEADIHFIINQSVVRPTELKADDIVGLNKFLTDSKTEVKEGKKVVSTTQNYNIKGFSIIPAASPDGELDRNNNLANDRGAATKKVVADFLKKSNIATPEGVISVQSIGEDWDGFKKLMEASTVPDKEMILRILSTYSDNNVRKREIKNISKAYTEIADQVFPKLRKSIIRVEAEKPAKTDEELKQLVASSPDKLTVEEILYAANLLTDVNQQLAAYQAAARVYPNDWRGHNNAGCIYVMQNKVSDAVSAFEKADQANSKNTAIKTNLMAAAMLKGDDAKAQDLYKEAGNTPEANYNMGKIHILKGKYGEAVSDYGTTNTYNAALAKLLNGDKEGALKTLEASKDATTAKGYYLKAVIAARMSNQAMLTEALAKAFEKDPSLKEKAKSDKEFVKYTLN